MSDGSLVEFVLQSSVRSDVVREVVDGTSTTDELLASVDASESAVYNALGALERRGLVRSLDGERRATASGQLVADLLAQQRDVCRLLDGDEEYWETHDVTVLPQRFRARCSELADATVMHASDTDPHRVVREVADRIGTADDAHVISPIYQATFEESMPDSENSRLLLDPSLVREAFERIDDPSETRQFEHTEVRLLDVDVALGVTDDSLMLSLPTLDGQYDSRTEVVAETDRAIEWGRDLFEHYWERATPVEDVIEDIAP